MTESMLNAQVSILKRFKTLQHFGIHTFIEHCSMTIDHFEGYAV